MSRLTYVEPEINLLCHLARAPVAVFGLMIIDYHRLSPAIIPVNSDDNATKQTNTEEPR